MAALFFFAAVAGGSAFADDHRLSLTVIAADTGAVYQVQAPGEASLHAVKRMILVKIGLSARHARDYLLEKAETVMSTQTTTTYSRTGPTTQPVTTQTTVYTALTDEGESLETLGIEDGDTLRLTFAPGRDASLRRHHHDHDHEDNDD